jgi:hypothetical protein
MYYVDRLPVARRGYHVDERRLERWRLRHQYSDLSPEEILSIEKAVETQLEYILGRHSYSDTW